MDLYLVFGTLIFFVVVCLGTFITLLKRKGWLFLFTPLTLFVVVSLIYTYTALLGTPTEKDLPEEFFLVSYHPVEDEEVIYLWVLSHGETVPVAHIVPHTPELQELLDRLKRTAQEEGTTAIIRGFTPRESDDTKFELYYFMDQEYLQKDD